MRTLRDANFSNAQNLLLAVEVTVTVT